MKTKLIKLLRWGLYKLGQPCPKDLIYIGSERSNGLGYIRKQIEFITSLSEQEVELYILEKD